MIEVFTTGGGDYVVNTLNAVAAWSGGGGFNSAVRVVMALGLAYVLLIVAFNQDYRVLLKWFLQATIIYLCVLVPTITVQVTDRLNPTLRGAAVANVPVGLGVLAGFTSQLGDWLTERAELVFVLPSSLKYNTNGMVYGARLLEITRQVRIENPVFAANLESHMKFCVFYDVLQGHKDMGTLARTPNLWTALGPGSQAKFQPYITASVSSPTTAENITCREAYTRLTAAFRLDYDQDFLLKKAKQVYPDRVDAAARAKFQADVSTGVSQSAFENVRQALTINAFAQARDNFGGGTGEAQLDGFAATRADLQARNTYSTIAQSAMKWVPLLHIILTVVFYAIFPIVFLVFLLPQGGTGVLRSYFAGFFYLATFGPLFAIINMFIMSRAQSSMLALTADAGQSGAAMVNFAGIGALNDETATLAGTFIAFIPVLAGLITKGAGAAASSSESLLAPAKAGAEAAAVEATTGNLSYGNVTLDNQTFNTRNSDQWTTAPRLNYGEGITSYTSPNGSVVRRNAEGGVSYDSTGANSNIRVKPSFSQSDLSSISRRASESKEIGERLSNSASSELSAARTAGIALADTFTASSGSSTETGSGHNRAASIAAEKSRNISDQLQKQFGLSKEFSEGVGKSMVYSGSLSAEQSSTLSGSIGSAAKFGLSSRNSHSTGKRDETNANLRQGVSRKDALETGLQFVERMAKSENLSDVRDSFIREASSSGNSETRSLAERLEGHLSQAGRLAASSDRYKSEGQRLDRAFEEASNASFNSSTDLSQQFAAFADAQLAANPELRSTGYRPDLTALTPAQAQVEESLVRGFKRDYVEKALGTADHFAPFPDYGLSSPTVGSAADVRRSAEAISREIGAQRPAGDIRTDSRDAFLEGRVSSGIDAYGSAIEKTEGYLGRQTEQARDKGDLLKEHVRDLNSDPGATVAGHNYSIPSLLSGWVFDSSKKNTSNQAVARFYGVGVKLGANISGGQAALQPVIAAVANTARDLGLPAPVITSGNDSAVHIPGSAHYRDGALDFRGNNISVAQGRVLARNVSRALGSGYRVQFETFPKNPSRNHLHVQYGGWWAAPSSQPVVTFKK
jgi:conjugal transfer mating pair stabilization protein TraG